MMFLKNKSTRYIMGISFIHAALLILMVFGLNNQSYIHWDESTLSRLATILKKSVLGIDPKPAKEDFLFVNIGYDIETIDMLDEYEFPLGKQVITDREVLGRFLEVLNKNPTYRFVFLDIYFDTPTAKDSLLARELKKAKHLLTASYIRSDTSVSQSIFEAPTGIINFLGVNGDDFFRYKTIFNDSLKTVPLRMHEELSGNQFTNGEYLYSKAGSSSFYLNNFTLDYRIRPYDIFERDDKYMMVNLGQELLQLKDSDIQDLVKGRIVVVGDFVERDKHNTIFGQMPGSFIITNAYLALKAEDNKITLLYLLFLFTGFFVMSMFIFSPTDKLKNYLDKVFPYSGAVQWILSYLTYATYLTLMALLSYILFNIFINVIVISVYAKIVDWAVERKFYKNLKEKSSYSIP
jgi:hypothetical protein